jgi:adenylate cyclase
MVQSSSAIEGLDPSPRIYPKAIVLVRRLAGRPSAAHLTFGEIESWLLGEAVDETDMLHLLESFIRRLIGAGSSIDRVTLHVGTLHPQLVGFAWNWNSADAFCDEVRVTETAVASDSYTRNPLQQLFESGVTIRRSPHDPKAIAEFPLMAELAQEGMTDYVALPLSGPGYRNAMTIATKRLRGLPKAELETLYGLLGLFALHVQRHSEMRIASNTLTAYLGSGAAEKVLGGKIKRGAGESVRAVIWVSDLRGFTDMSDRISGSEMLTLLNAYFEAMADAVIAHGGEVLKFIGDGVLAVFPTANEDQATAAAEAALSAAHQAIAQLSRLNSETPHELASINGWKPLRVGIAIHEGEVFFGNVGSAGRIDFTVIGPAVNEAFRVEALQKSLGREILITEAAAQHLKGKMDMLGEHRLRGVTSPIAIYSPI